MFSSICGLLLARFWLDFHKKTKQGGQARKTRGRFTLARNVGPSACFSKTERAKCQVDAKGHQKTVRHETVSFMLDKIMASITIDRRVSSPQAMGGILNHWYALDRAIYLLAECCFVSSQQRKCGLHRIGVAVLRLLPKEEMQSQKTSY